MLVSEVARASSGNLLLIIIEYLTSLLLRLRAELASGVGMNSLGQLASGWLGPFVALRRH